MAGVPKIMQSMFYPLEPRLKEKLYIREIIVHKPEGDIAHLALELQKKYKELDIEVIIL